MHPLSCRRYTRSLLNDGIPVTPGDIVGWLLDAICGLHHMHHAQSRPHIHRDLKPSNMLVFRATAATGASLGAHLMAHPATSSMMGASAGATTSPPPSPSRPAVMIKLGDLGESTTVRGELDLRLTDAAGVGTLFVMAPEMSREGVYSPAGDVFAWAVSMCMVAYDSDVSRDARRYLASRELVLRRGLEIFGRHSGALRVLLEECLESDPARRPCSGEVRDRLMHIAGVWPRFGALLCSLLLECEDPLEPP
jgi:serine/threonine protein kinase